MGKVLLLLYLVVVSIFDWRKRNVPAVLLAAGFVLAAAAGFYNRMHILENAYATLLECGLAMLPGLFLLLMAWLTQKIGWGDGVVLLIVGLARDFRWCLVLLCLSLLLMALICMVLLLLRRVGKHTALPYLPFLTAAYLAVLFM